MKLRKPFVFLSSLFLLLSFSSSALACACCAERGFYSVTRSAPDNFYLGLIGEMNFSGTAEFYTSSAGFDAIKGLEDLAKDDKAGKPVDLNIVETFLMKTWRLNVKTGAGRIGTLALPMPAMMTVRKIDIHDSQDTGLGVTLYKEYTFNGKVARGTGIFRAATKTTNYTLIFQGRGNACDDASNFTNWRLELKGPRVDFAAFGKTKPGRT